jgi:hypothetical protein
MSLLQEAPPKMRHAPFAQQASSHLGVTWRPASHAGLATQALLGLWTRRSAGLLMLALRAQVRAEVHAGEK